MNLKIYGSEKPVRLFVAGLHGDEWKDTTEILLGIKPPKTGILAVIPLVSKGDYISTLEERYYEGMGKPIIAAIEKFRPEIYLELHSYAKENFEKLAGKDRAKRVGVPAFSVLKEGVLLGSVSPHIRRKYFSREALCLSFEIEKGNRASKLFASSLAETLKEIRSRDEFLEFLKSRYPEQAKKAVEDYRRFYGHI